MEKKLEITIVENQMDKKRRMKWQLEVYGGLQGPYELL